LSTTIEDLSSTSKRLKVEIPADIIEKEYISSLDNIRQRARIPGFRPGKSPVSLIEKNSVMISDPICWTSLYLNTFQR